MRTGPDSYTSARIKTLGKFAEYRHTWEARIKLPTGAGVWPAWWLMGPAGWPQGGEIDIVESFGNSWAPATTVWTPNASGTDMVSSQQAEFVNDGNWHTWRMTWGADLVFTMDGREYFAATPDAGWIYANGKPMFILLNLAVGGTGGGAVPSTRTFPVDMLIDYVRVW